MRWLIPLVIVCSAASARADGFYYTEGGGAVNVGDELGTYFHHKTATRLRVAIGTRRADWALELFFAGALNPMNLPENNGGRLEATDVKSRAPDLVEYGLDLKKLFPLNRHFEVFLHGNASLGFGTGTLDGYAGRGLGFGAGAQLKGRGSVFGLLFPPLFWIVRRGPMMTGAVFVENGYEFHRLHDQRAQTAIDAQLTYFTLGFALGSDF